MHRKAWVLLIGFIVVFLYGCSETDNRTDVQSEADTVVTLTMTAPSGELYDVDRKLIRKYEEYSGNRIDLQEIPDDQYTNVLKARLTSGMRPDMAVIWPRTNASQFIPERFLDLSKQEWLTL